MTLRRRKFLHLAAGAAALPGVSLIARAQTYPTRPVRMIVPFAAGGPQFVSDSRPQSNALRSSSLVSGRGGVIAAT
jgi:hypothetical protein